MGKNHRTNDLEYDTTEMKYRGVPKGTRGRRKNKTGGEIFLAVLLICILIGLTVYSLSMFFYVETIEVSGNERYETGEILAVAGIPDKENMFKVKTEEVRKKIAEKFPYIDSVAVKKVMPSTVRIEVSETQVDCFVQDGDNLIGIDRNLKVLEVYSGEAPQKLPVVSGLPYAGEAVGERISEENVHKKTALSDIIAAINKHDLTKSILSIDLSDEFYIAMNFEDRVELRLGNYSKIEEKLDFFSAIRSHIHESDGGILDLSDPQKAPFISKNIKPEAK